MQLVIISLIWLEADSPLVGVTPRILREATRTIPGIGRGGIALSVLCVVLGSYVISAMSYVIDKLYLGDIDDAMKSFDLSLKKGVTHILTVDR